MADTFEALLGAIYLDSGIEKATQFLSIHLFPNAVEIVEKKTYIDYKSLLQEIIQEQSRISPIYRVIKSEGPDHAKIFWMEAVAGNRSLSTGSGKSKQEAEQEAAYNALEKMGRI